MKINNAVFQKLSHTMLVFGCLFLVSNGALAQDIQEILGDYHVFLSNADNSKHDGARIIIMRTGDGPGVNELATYGLAFVSNVDAPQNPKGDGLLCDDATLILNDSAMYCTKIVKNPAGRVIFEETYTVGVTGSLYCNALKASLVGDGHEDKIADDDNENCDEENEQCVCYDIDHRGKAPFGPPTQGSGSGSGGG